MPGSTGYGTAILLTVTLAAAAQPAAGPLRVHARNPRYFDDGTGKAVYLTGSHTHYNLQDGGETDPPDALDFSGHLSWLLGYGHNFTRGWAWEHARWAVWTTGDFFITPLPFPRTGPGNALDGKPRFDVSRFDQAYFDRIRARALEAQNRGIYIGIMLFEGWSIEDKDQNKGNPWPGHPFHRSNNINGIDGDPSGDNEGHEVHTLAVAAVTAIQEAYVEKMIDTLNDLDNVIWQISNESHTGSVQWQYHMINHIKAYEAAHKPKQHLVWMEGWEIPNADLFASPADIVSPNRHNGGEHYRTGPHAADGSKVVILDTDHLWGYGGDRDWVWKSFTRGYHPIYMDPLQPPYDPNDARSIRVRQAMGYTLAYANRMNLVNAVPQASGTSKPASTQYCLYAPGVEYVVFQPGTGAFSVDLPAGSCDYEWFNPVSGVAAQTARITVPGGLRTFTPPFSGMAVLFIDNYVVAPELVQDTFTLATPNRQAADPLNGTLTEVGNATWTATDSVVFGDGGFVTNTWGVSPAASVAFDPTAYGNRSVSVEAQLNVADGLPEAWLSIGFMSGTGLADTDGEVWMRVQRDGGYTVLCDGTAHVLAQGDLPIHEDRPKHAYLLYNHTENTVSAWLNGVPILTAFDLDVLSFVPNSTRAGFTASHISDLPAGAMLVDDFAARVGSEGPPPLLGDLDDDGDLDQADFGLMQTCFSGSSIPYGPGCGKADLDANNAVDQLDAAMFLNCMSGANRPPGC